MAHKIDRSAFLYLEPKGLTEDFAQCRTCSMWIRNKVRCTIHGPDVEVRGDMTCGFYINGKPHPTDPMKMVTPEESGLEDRDVRCENCKWFDWDNTRCNLYVKLNSRYPYIFDLDVSVSSNGCCNANIDRH